MKLNREQSKAQATPENAVYTCRECQNKVGSLYQNNTCKDCLIKTFNNLRGVINYHRDLGRSQGRKVTG